MNEAVLAAFIEHKIRGACVQAALERYCVVIRCEMYPASPNCHHPQIVHLPVCLYSTCSSSLCHAPYLYHLCSSPGRPTNRFQPKRCPIRRHDSILSSRRERWRTRGCTTTPKRRDESDKQLALLCPHNDAAIVVVFVVLYIALSLLPFLLDCNRCSCAYTSTGS